MIYSFMIAAGLGVAGFSKLVEHFSKKDNDSSIVKIAKIAFKGGLAVAAAGILAAFVTALI